MKQVSSVIFFCLLIGNMHAQDSLTLQRAIALALKNNTGILIATNEKEIAELNSHAGNAGMLPIVGVNATGSTGATNSLQEFANGTTQERNNAKSTGVNAGVNASWVVFDGMRMFATREKLRELEAMGELQLRAIIESTVEQVCLTYYNAERLKEQLLVYRNSIVLYQERENLAELKLKSGNGNRTEYLQASVERSTQENNILQIELEWKNALVTLHRLLGETADTLRSTTDSLMPPSYAASMLVDVTHNTDLQMAVTGIGIAQLEKREAGSDYFPRISIGGSYNFINNNSQAGFVLLNRNIGYSGLINFSWTLFNGNTSRVNTRIARIQVENRELFKQETELLVKENYQRAFNQYTLALVQIQNEQKNLLIADENQRISMQRYREGKSSLIEVREAQKYADDIRVRLVNTIFNANAAQVMMKRIKGELITESK